MTDESTETFMRYFIQIASRAKPHKLRFGQVEMQPKSGVGLRKIADAESQANMCYMAVAISVRLHKRQLYKNG